MQVLEEAMNDEQTKGSKPSSIVKSLLRQYADVFYDPKGLLPHRTHEQAIDLILDTKLILIRLYRIYTFQKNEIEKIVQDLLTSNVSQTS